MFIIFNQKSLNFFVFVAIVLEKTLKILHFFILNWKFN